MTAELHQREGRPTLQLPWDTWAGNVPGANVPVYTDTGARQDRGCFCCSSGFSANAAATCASYVCSNHRAPRSRRRSTTYRPSTTPSSSAVVLSTYVSRGTAAPHKFVADTDHQTHAAPSLFGALQWLVGEAAAAHWWVKSHQEVLELTSRHGSGRQECQRTGTGSAPATVGDVRNTSHGAGLSGYGVAHSRTEQMEAAAGPPSPNGNAPPRVPGDGNSARAATPGDVAPTPRGLPSLRKAQRGHDAYRWPCHRAKWRRAL